MTQMTYKFDSDVVSDLHKDAYGFRPKVGFWNRWNAASDDVKQEIWDGLVAFLNQEVIRERERQEQAERDFEVRIQQLMSMGAKTREMAIRWLDEAYETNGDYDYLEYSLGLTYGYLKKAA